MPPVPEGRELRRSRWHRVCGWRRRRRGHELCRRRRVSGAEGFPRCVGPLRVPQGGRGVGRGLQRHADAALAGSDSAAAWPGARHGRALHAGGARGQAGRQAPGHVGTVPAAPRVRAGPRRGQRAAFGLQSSRCWRRGGRPGPAAVAGPRAGKRPRERAAGLLAAGAGPHDRPRGRLGPRDGGHRFRKHDPQLAGCGAAPGPA
mmetsp:Transcript_67761/g.201589  ORF Transcript_67761/g.201589 Transcript_67761/m.201589 type:complete len:203 (-) Transcript_67761:781-1389(-)